MLNHLRTGLVAAATLAMASLVHVPASLADDEPAPMEIDGATTVDAEQVISLFNGEEDLTIVDSRKPSDYADGHIETAVNLINTETDARSLKEVVGAKDTPVLFYCNGIDCGRAADAVERAKDAGYTDIYYYALGMEEWNEKGLPLVSE